MRKRLLCAFAISARAIPHDLLPPRPPKATLYRLGRRRNSSLAGRSTLDERSADCRDRLIRELSWLWSYEVDDQDRFTIRLNRWRRNFFRVFDPASVPAL